MEVLANHLINPFSLEQLLVCYESGLCVFIIGPSCQVPTSCFCYEPIERHFVHRVSACEENRLAILFKAQFLSWHYVCVNNIVVIGLGYTLTQLQ